MTRLGDIPWEAVPQPAGPEPESETEQASSAPRAGATAGKKAARHYPARPPSNKKRWRWTRERAVQALYQQLLNFTPPDQLEAQFMEDPFMLKVDLALFRHIVRGVSEQGAHIDAVFAPLLDRPLAELDPIEHAILRLGAFELMHSPEIPRAVAINEAVEMAKLYGATEGHRYINGVLDKLADQVRPHEARR
ncbi:transcription antitermination factor NusB [Halothiobacillus sp. DCM-1]|uniref:transcription antitermination factor NusB n=1 Tax=Halothiobacillus sp. DCM-1 TaxID=3112558 RepID=UPI003250D726